MKDEDFLNQKASDMTIKELTEAIKIKHKQQDKIGDIDSIPLQVLFQDKTLEVIERLQKNSGVKHRGDVVRDALALYDKIDRIAVSGEFIVIDYRRTRPEHKLTIPRKKKEEEKK